MKPSPLALLAATCSKIGTGVDAEAGSAAGQQNQKAIQVQIAPNQVVSINDLLNQPGILQQLAAASPGGFIQQLSGQNSGFFDLASPQKSGQVQIVSTGNSGFGAQLQMQPQMIATPVAGPGGTITYNLIPQYQSVVVVGQDGQEQTVMVPAGSLLQGQMKPQQTQQQVVQQQKTGGNSVSISNISQVGWILVCHQTCECDSISTLAPMFIHSSM